MAIEYKDTKDFTAEELKRLFLSVKWSSGSLSRTTGRGIA